MPNRWPPPRPSAVWIAHCPNQLRGPSLNTSLCRAHRESLEAAGFTVLALLAWGAGGALAGCLAAALFGALWAVLGACLHGGWSFTAVSRFAAAGAMAGLLTGVCGRLFGGLCSGRDGSETIPRSADGYRFARRVLVFKITIANERVTDSSLN